MVIYVVRHGQTEWNVLKKMQGSADIPINKKVLEQAQQTKTNLNHYEYDMIFCSPLIRAKQIANITNEDKNLDIVYDERLRKRNYGEFEGVSKTSFNYNDFWTYNKNIKYIKAENVQVFFNRIYNFLDDLKLKYSEKNILIVCHADIMKAIECYANGMMSDDAIGPYPPDNASVLEYNL